jgi:hypothetical protein
LRAEHPIKLISDGTVSTIYEIDTCRFPAFSGSEARIKIRGKYGFEPTAETVLTPDVGVAALEAPVVGEGDLRREAFPCESFGDYRLQIKAGNGSYGRWKAKIKLSHPSHEGRELEVEGITAEEAPSHEIPVPPVEEPEPAPDEEPSSLWPLKSVVQSSTFRVTLEFADPPPDPSDSRIRYFNAGVRLRACLENVTSTTQTISWFAPPQASFAFKHSNGNYYGAWRGIDWQKSISYPPGPILDTTSLQPLSFFTYYSFPPGEYEITVFYTTGDTRIPKTAKLRCILK